MTDFEDFARTTNPTVLRTVALALGDPDVAQDASQEAFAKAALRWGRVRGMERPAAWVSVVAVNTGRRMLRRRRNDRGRLGVVADDHAGEVVDRLSFRRELAALPQRQRALRRRRGFLVASVAVVVLVGAGVGIANLTGRASPDLRTAPMAELPSGPDPALDDGVVPDAPHYYKATVTLAAARGSAPASRDRVTATAAAITDDHVIAATAAGAGESTARVGPRIAAFARPDESMVDVVAIGTDPSATVRLADAAVAALSDDAAAASEPVDLRIVEESGAVEINRQGFVLRFHDGADRLDDGG